MWPTRAKQLAAIENGLDKFSRTKRQMPGIRAASARKTLAMQMIASIRRLEYTEILKKRSIDPHRADPNDPLFDPERAALIHSRAGDFDEAIWLIFLSTHF